MKPQLDKKLEPKPENKINGDNTTHAHDPFVLKKAAESKAFLEKHGFPEEYRKRK